MGNRIRKNVEEKRLLDDDFVIDTVQRIIVERNLENILLEGFPKTPNQAVVLEKLVAECSTVIELSTNPELLTKRIMFKLAEQKGITCNPEDVNARINDYNEKIQSILKYYKGLGKLRRIDCAKSTAEVYTEIQRAVLPSTYFIIGAKGSGKTIVCDHYASVMGMKIIDFEQWASTKKDLEHEALLFEFIKELHQEPIMKVGIKGLPKILADLKYFILNGVKPNKVIYVNATEGKCILNSPSENVCEEFKQFQKQTKDLIIFCKKNDMFYEVTNSEDTQVQDLKDNAMKLFAPELIILRAQEGMEDALESTSKELNTMDYLAINQKEFESQEILRETKVGLEFKSLYQEKKRIPLSLKIELLKKIIYPTSDNKKIVLSRFPDTPEELEELERTCCKVTSEFFLCKPEYIMADEYNLETYMHARGKLTPIDAFNPELMDSYRGKQLQYALILGPVTSGKTTVAKLLTKLGFTFLEMAALEEDIKKKLATEDNPAESITVTFPQKLEELKLRTLRRKFIDERFVIDGIDSEDFGSFKKIVTALGPPSDYIVLKCDPKEVKKRYMKKNEMTELSEDDNAKIDGQLKNFEKVKEDLDEVISELSGVYRIHQVTADGTEDEVAKNIREIFEPKLIIIKSDDDPNINEKLVNLSLKYSFLYLSVPDLIKHEIEQKTPLGIDLDHTKKPQELINDNEPYCSAHYEQKLIFKLLKENMKKVMGKYQIAVIYGYLSAYKLKGWEERQQFRVMDELFNLEKEVGTIKSVIDIVKDDFESVENKRTREKITIKIKAPPKPASGPEGEEKKEENEEPQDKGGGNI